jgi:hypothetical protein
MMSNLSRFQHVGNQSGRGGLQLSLLGQFPGAYFSTRTVSNGTQVQMAPMYAVIEA